MATWTDGAAYAPIERPDGFATPEAEPLAVAEPQHPQTPGPMAPPADFAPSGPSVPLEAIRTETPSTREPEAPFQVSSALLAPGIPASGERDPRQPFTTSGAGPDALPPPSGAPLAAPGSVPVAASPQFGDAPPPGPPPSGAPLPAPQSSPGALQYPPPNPAPPLYGSGQPGYVPARSSQADQQVMQLQSIASVLLFTGFLFWSAAPILLVVGGGLLMRAPHRRNIAIGALIAGGITLLMTLGLPDSWNWVAPIACLTFFVASLTNRRPPRQHPWAQ